MASKNINYSIENIEACIAQDSEISKKYDEKKKKKLYEENKKLLKRRPDVAEILSLKELKKYKIPGVEIFARVGFIPPQIVIVDPRARNMCQNHFWLALNVGGKRVSKFGPCPGYGIHSSCPPNFPPPISRVREMIDSANLFFLLQSKPLHVSGLKTGAAPWQGEFLYQLQENLENKLGKGTVIDKYSAGPCQACLPERCLTGGKCRSPEKQTHSLEGMGIPCGQLCRDMALLSGDESWKLKWIKHFGFPHQTPKTYKLVWGAALKVQE